MSDLPRFYVREHTGYKFNPGAGTSGHARQVHQCMVIDRDYCHRVVSSMYPHPRRRLGYEAALTLARQQTAERCAELNAADEDLRAA